MNDKPMSKEEQFRVGTLESALLADLATLGPVLQGILGRVARSLVIIHDAGLYEAYGDWPTFLERIHRSIGRQLGVQVGIHFANWVDDAIVDKINTHSLPQLRKGQGDALQGLTTEKKMRVYRMAAVSGDTTAKAILEMRAQLEAQYKTKTASDFWSEAEKEEKQLKDQKG